jgi:SynChlorMet cassette protein ScmD
LKNVERKREAAPVKNGEKPIANPYVILREEFDDWAILFNPDTGHGFGLSPTGVYVWKLLDGEHTMEELLMALRRDAFDVAGNVHDDVGAFVDALVAEGLTGAEMTNARPLADPQGREPNLEEDSPRRAEHSEEEPFAYDPPKLIDFKEGRAVGEGCTSHGSQGGDCLCNGLGATGTCQTGDCGNPNYNACCPGACNYPTGNCRYGCGPQYFCETGNTAGNWCSTGNGTAYNCACETGTGPNLS